MIYLFSGTDIKKRRKCSQKFLEELFLKKPDASLVEIGEEDFSGARCGEFIASQGLFERIIVVVFSHILKNKEAEEFIKKNIKILASSHNIFVFLEGELSKNILALFGKNAHRIWSFNTALRRRKREFNIFSLSDALGIRDRKKSWILLQQAYMHNMAPENVHGVLFWFTKNMLLIKKETGRTAKELGLNPFVFKKTLSYSKNYTLEELAKLSRDLVGIYHDARRGALELEMGIEKLILKI